MTEQDNCPDLFFQAHSHTYTIFCIPERITFPYKVQVLTILCIHLYCLQFSDSSQHRSFSYKYFHSLNIKKNANIPISKCCRSLKDTANIFEENTTRGIPRMNLAATFFSLILKLYQKSKTVRMTTIILQQEKALNYLKI